MPKSGRMHLGIWAYLSRHDLFALVSVTSNHFLVVWYIWPQELCAVRGERFIGVRRIFSCLCLQGIQLLLGAVPRTLHQLCNSQHARRRSRACLSSTSRRPQGPLFAGCETSSVGVWRLRFFFFRIWGQTRCFVTSRTSKSSARDSVLPAKGFAEPWIRMDALVTTAAATSRSSLSMTTTSTLLLVFLMLL